MAESTDVFTSEEQLQILAIKSNIRSKVGYLKKLIPAVHYDDMFLCGGAIASIIQGKFPNDWDVYFTNVKTQKAVIDLFMSDHSDEIAVVDEKYREVYGHNGKIITENAMTLNNDIQFIIKHNGTPDEVRMTFDFVHCLPYYHFGKDLLFISREQFDLCRDKKLKINNMKSVTTWRQSKFEQRGYTWQL
jgi:hypothetical protein